VSDEKLWKLCLTPCRHVERDNIHLLDPDPPARRPQPPVSHSADALEDLVAGRHALLDEQGEHLVVL
jgi:hypothetical protein